MEAQMSVMIAMKVDELHAYGIVIINWNNKLSIKF